MSTRNVVATQKPPFFATCGSSLSCEISGHDHHSPLAVLSSGLQQWSAQVSG